MENDGISRPRDIAEVRQTILQCQILTTVDRENCFASYVNSSICTTNPRHLCVTRRFFDGRVTPSKLDVNCANPISRGPQVIVSQDSNRKAGIQETLRTLGDHLFLLS